MLNSLDDPQARPLYEVPFRRSREFTRQDCNKVISAKICNLLLHKDLWNEERSVLLDFCDIIFGDEDPGSYRNIHFNFVFR